MTHEWQITFPHKTKEKTFTQRSETEEDAILGAQHVFQAVYGYWPTNVVQVVKILKPKE